MPSYLPLVVCCSRRNGYYASAVRVRQCVGDQEQVLIKDYGDHAKLLRHGVPLYKSRSGAWRHASNHLLPTRARSMP